MGCVVNGAMRLAAWVIAAVASGLFVWSLRQTPPWAPGCLAGSIIAGIAVGLLWTPDDPTHGQTDDWRDKSPWL